MHLLSPVNESPSLDRLAYEQVKEAILTFRFLPGQVLVEGELAVQLGISKTPVRDALMHLEKEGLVSRIAYRGTYVSDISNQDMANIFQIRIVLEGLAIRLAVDALTNNDHGQMELLIQDHANALLKKDYTLVSKINNDFHNVIIQKCSNPHLIDMLHNLDDHLKRYRLLSIAQGLRTDKSVPEHRVILAAIQAHDPDGAEQAMRNHLFSAMRDLYDQNFEELVQQLHNHPIPVL